MQEDEKKTVDIDTSGPEVEVALPEEKKEDVVDQTGLPIINQDETDKTYENEGTVISIKSKDSTTK